jgi:hypothetical protein
MDVSPFSAHYRDQLGKFRQDTLKFGTAEAVIATKYRRAPRTVENEDGLISSTDHMDMGRAMVIWVNDHAKAPQSGNCRHSFLQNPSA